MKGLRSTESPKLQTGHATTMFMEPPADIEWLTPWEPVTGLGHTADEEGHKLFRSQLDESENLRADSRNLIFFEQAREWLLEEET